MENADSFLLKTKKSTLVARVHRTTATTTKQQNNERWINESERVYGGLEKWKCQVGKGKIRTSGASGLRSVFDR